MTGRELLIQHDPQRASRLLRQDIEKMQDRLAKLEQGEVEPLLAVEPDVEPVDTDDYWTEFITFDPLFHDRTKLSDEEIARVMNMQS